MMEQSGLRELLQYGNELAKPNFEDYGDVRYADKPMYALEGGLRAEAIEMSTLTGLVDYIRSSTDDSTAKMIVQVVSPERVKLISALDDDRKREILGIETEKEADFVELSVISNLGFKPHVQHFVRMEKV